MIELLLKEYFSKADAFILPLTGLSNEPKYGMRSYLFWNEYSIENYQFVVTFDVPYDDREEFFKYCGDEVFPILDKNGYLLENYEVGNRYIYILDLSEWALDIEMFLAGKYSKLSIDARRLIEQFHKLGPRSIPYHIFGILYPNKPVSSLNNRSSLVYVSEEYELDLAELQKIGELGTIYDKEAETLITV